MSLSFDANNANIKQPDLPVNIQKVQQELVELNQVASNLTAAIVNKTLAPESWMKETQKKVSELEEFAKKFNENKKTNVEEAPKEDQIEENSESSIAKPIGKKLIKKAADKTVEHFTGLNITEWKSIEQRLEYIAEETIYPEKQTSISFNSAKKSLEKKWNEIQSNKAMDKGLEHFTGMNRADFEKIDKGADVLIEQDFGTKEEKSLLAKLFDTDGRTLKQARKSIDKGLKHFLGYSTKECEDVVKTIDNFQKKSEVIANDEKISPLFMTKHEDKEPKIAKK